MQHHVQQKPPNLPPFIGPVDEHRIYGHGSGGIHLTPDHRVIYEESELKQKEKLKRRRFQNRTLTKRM